MTKVLKILGSTVIAFALILAIAAVSVFGTLIEQKKSLEVIYHSPIFVFLLAALGLNLACCTLLRLRLRLRLLGFLATHIGVLLILAGAVIGGAYGSRGVMQLAVGEVSSHFFPDYETQNELPFSLRLNRFSVEYYDFGDLIVADNKHNVIAEVPAQKGAEFTINDYSIKITDFMPDFVKDFDTGKVVTRSQVPQNPALHVSVTSGEKANERWVFANFPQLDHFGSGREPLPFIFLFQFRERIKAYKSDVSVLSPDGVELLARTVEVNLPLSYRGYTFYQMSYDRIHHNWSGIQVVKDPGVPVVYAGFCLLTFGIFFIFYAKNYFQKKTVKREKL